MSRLTITLALTLITTTASAQSGQGFYGSGHQPSTDGTQAHEGLMIRVTPNLNGAAVGASDGPNDVTISGGGVGLGAAVGGSVAQNIIVMGEALVTSAVDPTVTVNDEEFVLEDAELQVVYLGAGVSYYTYSNVYFHGGIGIQQFGGRNPGETETNWTDTGVAVKGAIGKEWWVANDWAMGLSGEVYLGQVPEEDNPDEAWSTAIFTLNLSATYD